MHNHHHGHGHHDHDGRHHDHSSEWLAATRDHRALLIATVMNVALVIMEYVFGYLSGSLALMADASHNLSDCLSLVLAWIAMRLAQKRPDPRFTYGLGSSTILVTLMNGLVLLVIGTFLAFEAAERLNDYLHPTTDVPLAIDATTMLVVSSIAAGLNFATAWLFYRSQAKDLNLRRVYIHMIVDAAVSVGVVLAALGIETTGWAWLDPAFTIIIVVALFYATWSLVAEGFRLVLQAVPAHIKADKVKAWLETLPGVTAVHDFHVWALSTREVALTAHLIMPGGHPGDRFLADTSAHLRDTYGIIHATLQIETSPHEVKCGLDGHTH